jgi:malonate transporter and related proteins
MEYVLAVTTPIYLLIAVGFLAVRLGWMTPADMRVLGRFTAQFGVPALLFRAISRQPLSAVQDQSRRCSSSHL